MDVLRSAPRAGAAYSIAAVALAAALSGCGSAESAPADTLATEAAAADPVPVAATLRWAFGGPIGVGAATPGGHSVHVTRRPIGAASFEGQSRLVARETFSFLSPGQPVQQLVGNLYHDGERPYGWHGDTYTVYTGYTPPPAAAVVGASGDLLSGRRYTDASKGTDVGAVAARWSVEPNPRDPERTAYVCVRVVFTPGSTQSECYLIRRDDGAIFGLRLTVDVPGSGTAVYE